MGTMTIKTPIDPARDQKGRFARDHRAPEAGLPGDTGAFGSPVNDQTDFDIDAFYDAQGDDTFDTWVGDTGNGEPSAEDMALFEVFLEQQRTENDAYLADYFAQGEPVSLPENELVPFGAWETKPF